MKVYFLSVSGADDILIMVFSSKRLHNPIYKVLFFKAFIQVSILTGLNILACLKIVM
jgi:hypothetical protein